MGPQYCGHLPFATDVFNVSGQTNHSISAIAVNVVISISNLVLNITDLSSILTLKLVIAS